MALLASTPHPPPPPPQSQEVISPQPSLGLDIEEENSKINFSDTSDSTPQATTPITTTAVNPGSELFTSETVVDMVDSLSEEQCRQLLREIAMQKADVVQQMQQVLEQPLQVPSSFGNISEMLSWYDIANKPAIAKKNKFNILFIILQNIAESPSDFDLCDDPAYALQWNAYNTPCENQEFPRYVFRALGQSLEECTAELFQNSASVISTTLDQVKYYANMLLSAGFEDDGSLNQLYDKLEKLRQSCLKRPRTKQSSPSGRDKNSKSRSRRAKLE